MSQPIVNTVKKNTKLHTLDLERELRALNPISLDLRQFLYMELIVKEDHFRQAMLQHDWGQYQGRVVHLFCSVDTILPTWAWMLPIPEIMSFASHVVVTQDPPATEGTAPEADLEDLFRIVLDRIDWRSLEGRFVILKGCSEIQVPAWVYAEATRRAIPHARKILFGEACSNVPVYRS